MLRLETIDIPPAITAFCETLLAEVERAVADDSAFPSTGPVYLKLSRVSALHPLLGQAMATGIDNVVASSPPLLDKLFAEWIGHRGLVSKAKAHFNPPERDAFHFAGLVREGILRALCKRRAAPTPNPVLVTDPDLIGNPMKEVSLVVVVGGVVIGAALAYAVYLISQRQEPDRRAGSGADPRSQPEHQPTIQPRGGALAVAWTAASGVDLGALESAALSGRFEVVADAFTRFHSFRYFDRSEETEAFWAAAQSGDKPQDGRGTLRHVALLSDEAGSLRGDGRGPGLREADVIRMLPPDARTRLRFVSCDAPLTVDAGFRRRV